VLKAPSAGRAKSVWRFEALPGKPMHGAKLWADVVALDAEVVQKEAREAKAVPQHQAAKPKAAFVKDTTLPDGAEVAAGAELTKTWTVKNAGDTAWPVGAALVCVGGSMTPKEKRVALPSVAPGATADVSVVLKAPSAGRAKSVWRFEDDAKRAFNGDSKLWADVSVAAPAKARSARAATSLEKLAKLKQADFGLVSIKDLVKTEPNYRHGAYCDDSSVRLGYGLHTYFWHAAGHGVDLSQPAFEKRFAATAATAAPVVASKAADATSDNKPDAPVQKPVDAGTIQEAIVVAAPPAPTTAAAAPAAAGKFDAHIAQIAAMGFGDDSALLVPLLEEHKGDVQKVVLALLGA